MTTPRLSRTLAANLALAVSMGATAVFLARLLGPAEFGQYSLAATLCSLAAVVFTLGTGFSVRLLFIDIGDGAVAPYLVFSVITSVVSAVTVGIATLIFRDSASFALAVGALTLSMTLARQATDGLHCIGKTELAVVLASVSAAVTLLIAYFVWQFWTLTAVSAILASALALVLPTVIYVRGLARSGSTLSFRGRTVAPLKTLIQGGAPSLGHSLGLVILQRADRLLLGVLAGPAALGVYSVAAGVSEIGRLVPMAIGQVAFFRASTTAHQAQRLRFLGLLSSVLVALLTVVLAPLIIRTLFGNEYMSAVTPLRVLAIAEVAFTLTFIDSRILLAQGRARALGLVGVCSAGIGVLLYLALIPTWGATGAAIASLLSYSLMTVLVMRVLKSPRKPKMESRPRAHQKQTLDAPDHSLRGDDPWRSS